MALFLWKGPGQMEEVTHERALAPTLEEPGVPQLGQTDEIKLIECIVQDCNQRFKIPAIAARHFNSSHADLRDDAESWREYTQEIWVK